MTTSSTNGGTPTSSSSTYQLDPANPTGYAKTLEEHSGGTLTQSYTLGQDVISQWDSSHGLLTLTYDAHGSVRAAIGSAGAIQRYAYDAFGNLLSGTGLSSNLSATWTSLLYSGEQTNFGSVFHPFDPSTHWRHRLEGRRRSQGTEKGTGVILLGTEKGTGVILLGTGVGKGDGPALSRPSECLRLSIISWTTARSSISISRACGDVARRLSPRFRLIMLLTVSTCARWP